MASARLTGTSESISTFGSGAEDYTNIDTWESATDNDNVTGTVSPVLECSAGEYDQNVSLQTATNDATYFRIIRPVAGAFHTGVRDTGVRFYSTTDSTTISQNDFNDQVQDVCIRGTYNSTSSRGNATMQGGSDDAAYVGCIATDSQNAGSGLLNGFNSNSTATNRHFYIDCLAENNESTGLHVSGAVGSTPSHYNCTAVDNVGTGFNQGADSTATAVNCLASGNGTDFTGTIDTGSNNASSDATAGGTSPRIDQTFTFVNAAAFDYQLAATDAGAKGFGLDLSGDATYPFDDDIERTLWTVPWDIGAFNAVVAQQGPVTWFSPIVVVHRGGR